MCDPEIKKGLDKLDDGLAEVKAEVSRIIPRLDAMNGHLDKMNGKVADNVKEIAAIDKAQAVLGATFGLSTEMVRERQTQLAQAQVDHDKRDWLGLVKKNSNTILFVVLVIGFIFDIVKDALK